MHRSGTSAVTRVFSLLGATLPRELLVPAVGNPRGFWEPQAVVDLNERILSAAGSSVDDVLSIPPGWFESEESLAWLAPARAVIEREFERAPLFVLKDPRLALLLPIWRPVLEGMGVEPLFVITLRNPLEVAGSLRARDGNSLEKSLMLWLRYLLQAERMTRASRRTFVSIDELIDDWRGVAGKVARELGLAWPRPCEEAAQEVDAFLSPKLLHHSSSLDELEAMEGIPDWIPRAYATALAKDPDDERRHAAFDVISSELERADKAFGPLIRELRVQATEISELRSQLTEFEGVLSRREASLSDLSRQLDEAEQRASLLSREIERIANSISWRITAPIRAAKRAATLYGRGWKP